MYALGPQLLSQRGHWVAALLATRPVNALSHLSSTALRGITPEGPAIHVTTTGPSARKLCGVTVHRARRLDPADVTRIDDFPVMTLARTFLDLAETLPFHRLETIAEEAERRDLLDLDAIEVVMQRNPGRRGLRLLRSLLAHHRPLPITHEGLERQLQEIIAAEGIPAPLTNVIVHGHEVDAYWPQAKFAIELDSREFHSNWEAAERDRLRDSHLLRQGVVTERVTGRRMNRDRGGLVTDIRIQLRLGSRTSG